LAKKYTLVYVEESDSVNVKVSVEGVAVLSKGRRDVLKSLGGRLSVTLYSA